MNPSRAHSWLRRVCRHQTGAFRRASARLAETQSAYLLRLMREQENTRFGLDVGLETVRTVEDFRRRVPLSTYADYAPYLDRIRAGESGVLTRERVLRFEPTSGTGSVPKHIPYTRGLRRDVRRAAAPWIADLFDTYPALRKGHWYLAVSPRIRTERNGRVPVGFDADTGYIGGLAGRLAESVLPVPSAVGDIPDLEAFRYVTLLFLLGCPDLRLISVWNPTFLELLLALVTDDGGEIRDRLIRDLEAGTCSPPGDVPGPVADRLRSGLRPRPECARALSQAGESPWASMWPRLAVVSCWADGWAAEAVPRIRRLLPQATVQPKGLLATEAVVTIPLHDRPGAPPRSVLASASHFFEFRDVASGEVRLAHELADDRTYEVVVTTSGGLYRYRLGDRVTPSGSFGQAPVLHFLGRGDEVCDLRGEKLHEAFVAETLAELADGDSAPGYLCPFCTDGRAGYELVLPEPPSDQAALPGRLDGLLRRNPHYAYCRDLGQLAAPSLRILPSPSSAGPLSTAKPRALRQPVRDSIPGV